MSGARVAMATLVAGLVAIVPTAGARTAPASFVSADACTSVTFVGDSISASLNYVPAARGVLSSSFRMEYDLEVCRRLVAESCAFQGRRPSTALKAVRRRGGALGDVLVVHLGSNEGPAGFGRGMREVVRAARAQGARGVVWVTLRETLDLYRETNRAIRTQAKRLPSVVVADWATHSSGRLWFREDGLHLNAAGAIGLAHLLRARVTGFG